MTDNERRQATRMLEMLREYEWDFGLAVSDSGRLSLTMQVGDQPSDLADRESLWAALTACAPALEAILLEERDDTNDTLHREVPAPCAGRPRRSNQPTAGRRGCVGNVPF